MTALAIILSVAGGAFELGGIALVVFGIREDRGLADRYLTRVEEAPPAGFHGPIVRPEIRMMEDHALRHGPVDDRLRLTQERYAQDIRRITDAASRATYEERARFQSFVRDLLQGGLGHRKMGAGLVALGIVTSVAANVVSAVA
jgi:hypothetical protein